MSLAHDTINDTRRDDFFAQAREFGRDLAKGGDSLPNLAYATAIAVRDGVISLAKDGDGKDDIDRVYDAYTESASKKAKHEHTAGGKGANTSKLRAIGNAAMIQDFDFVEVLDRVVSMRGEMKKDPKAKLEGAYVAFVNAARAQMKPENLAEPLDDETIAGCIRKTVKTKTAVEELQDIYKKLNELHDDKSLEAAFDEIDDMTSLCREAIKKCDGEIPAVTKEEKQKAALLKKAKEMGLTLTVVDNEERLFDEAAE